MSKNTKVGAKYQKFKWATHLDSATDQKILDLKRFLYKEGVIPKNSKYWTVKYVLQWAFAEMTSKFPNYKESIEGVE